MVLPSRSFATSALKTVFRKFVAWLRIAVMVSGPNSQLAKNPDSPSSASRNGAVDSAHQNAACELIPNSESPHAFPSVRPMILRQRCSTGPSAAGTGPEPSRCQGTVTRSVTRGCFPRRRRGSRRAAPLGTAGWSSSTPDGSPERVARCPPDRSAVRPSKAPPLPANGRLRAHCQLRANPSETAVCRLPIAATNRADDAAVSGVSSPRSRRSPPTRRAVGRAAFETATAPGRCPWR